MNFREGAESQREAKTLGVIAAARSGARFEVPEEFGSAVGITALTLEVGL